MQWSVQAPGAAQEITDALKQAAGNKAEAARILKLHPNTFKSRLDAVMNAARAGHIGNGGADVPPGYQIERQSIHIVDGEERARWVKIKQDEADRQRLWLDAIEDTLERFKGFAPLPPAPSVCDSDLAVIYPRPDLHVGLYAWGDEAGEDWDVDIARETLGAAAGSLVASAPPAETAVVLGLGDYFHADDSRNLTPKSGNALDVDTRYSRVMRLGSWLEVAKVQLCLQRHRKVIYKALPGNHDPHSAVALALAVSMFFSAEPRVGVDLSPAMRWYWRFGVNLIGATHGHTVKQKELPGLMACDRPQDWGETSCKVYYSGHFHHLRTLEEMGVVCRQLRSPAARDAFHAAGPWISGRSMVADIYHREHGACGSIEYAMTGRK